MKKFCHSCQKATQFFNPKRVNHVLHAVLSILTLGTWLVVWLVLFLIALDSSPECIDCGTSD